MRRGWKRQDGQKKTLPTSKRVRVTGVYGSLKFPQKCKIKETYTSGTETAQDLEGEMDATTYKHSSENMCEIGDNTIHLIITSPPYPMIEKWDNLFGVVDFEQQH